MTRKEFTPLFMTLCEIYNRQFTELLAEGYYMALSELTPDEFQSSIKQILASRKFSSLPMPADLLEAIYGNPEDAAILAVNFVKKAIQRHGYYNTVSFSDLRINYVVEAMDGWQKICQMTSEEWKWAEKEFVKIYKATLGKPIKAPEYLLGKTDLDNMANGFIDKPENPYMLHDDVYESIAKRLPPIPKAPAIENRTQALLGDLVKNKTMRE